MLSRRGIAGAALVLLSGAAALACGPFFPWQLLDNRALTLKSTPVNSFAFEAAHIASPPKDKLKAAELPYYSAPEDAAIALGNAEAAGLSPAQAAKLRAARQAASGDNAYRLGDGLPLAIRLYTAGAVAYRKADSAGAKVRFEAVLALPETQRAPRAVWAAYMLGKIAGDNEAPAIFAKARRAALAGALDPLGLAVASYGEEARLHLHAAEALLEAGGATISSPEATQTASYTDAAKFSRSVLPARATIPFHTEIANAIALYAEQAAHGSDSGVQSLRLVAEFLLDSPDRIAATADEPLAQRLMLSYALKRLQNSTITRTAIWADNGDEKPGTADAKLDTALGELVDALEKLPHPAGADRLAALCYNLARWSCAKTMAEKSDSPLASWVKAKLASQKGDLADAAKFYAAAAHGFPTTDSLEEDSKKALLGESAVVALARGDYVDALDKLMPVSGTYWPDVAYIAERVLTTTELKSYVDSHVPAVTVSTSEAAPAYDEHFNAHAALRDLLARRLMRDGHFDEALAYFSAVKIRVAAKAYAAALANAARSWGRVDRAEALFAAATLARQSGLEMMGTEGPPDSFYTGGNFEEGLGRTTLSGDLITAGERQRFAASNAKPDQRFHYRYLAIEEAGRAADLLPPRSQAFAAVLCHASAWSSRDEHTAIALWKRYVKEGARVPFAKTFGRSCPAPDFQNAILFERKVMLRAVLHYVSHRRWWFADGGVLLLTAGFGLFVLRRRARA